MTTDQDTGWKRLAYAILLSAKQDWSYYSSLIKRGFKRRDYKKVFNGVCELRRLTNFVLSDWFDYLTDYAGKQNKVLNKLLQSVDLSQHRFLLNYFIHYYDKMFVIKEFVNDKLLPNKQINSYKKYVLLYSESEKKYTIAKTNTCYFIDFEKVREKNKIYIVKDTKNNWEEML